MLTRQSLITGRVTDAITGGRLRGTPVIHITDGNSGTTINHLHQRVTRDGFFTVYGDPARLPPPQDLPVRMVFDVPGYQSLETVVDFTPAMLSRSDRIISVDGVDYTVAVITGAPVQQELQIEPQPVSLRARVVRAEDTDQPIANANVAVIAPLVSAAVQTDSNGWVLTAPLPVAAELQLDITATGRDQLVIPWRPDFRQSINQGVFALEPS